MKYLVNADQQNRKKFNRLEIKNNFYKTLLRNQLIKKEFRNKLYLGGKRNSLNFINFSPLRIKNYCIISTRSRSVYRFFSLSRIKLKEQSKLGLLYGIRKSSW